MTAKNISSEELNSLKADILYIKQKVDGLEAQLKAAREKDREAKPLSTSEGWMIVITLALTFMLAIGAGASIFSSNREYKMIKAVSESAEMRAQEAHNLVKLLSGAGEMRAAEMHHLSIESATFAQKSADEFLAGSARTLTLVNDTLDLARQATARTVKSGEARVKSDIEEYDNTANGLINVETSHNDRRLVTDQRVRSKIISLARKLEEVERRVESINLEAPSEGAEKVQLSPACIFVIGMNHHLEGRWDTAREYWDRAVNSPRCPKRLASTIWHWIGYEQNNVGESDLEQSVASFQQAQKAADSVGVRSFELRRLELESRFFSLRPRVHLGDPEERRQLYIVADSLRDLAKELETTTGAEFADAWRSTLTTAGNIRLSVGKWWVGVRHPEKNEEIVKQMTNALEFYDQAATGGYIWALFGRAQALEELSKLQLSTAPAIAEARDPKNDYRLVLERLKRTEFARRPEPRTRMLNYATKMRCGLGLRVKSAFESALLAITETQSSVESPVTIYSHEMKCNVDKDTWLKEIGAMEGEARGLRGLWVEDEEVVLAAELPGFART